MFRPFLQHSKRGVSKYLWGCVFSSSFLIYLVYLFSFQSRNPEPVININQSKILLQSHDDSDREYFHYEFGKFHKPDYQNEQTLAIHPIVSTDFGTCQIHKIKSENGMIIPDYLWFEEYDQINVLVQLANSGKFYLFRQKKYGYPGESLAPIGGLVKPDEDPLDAAKRELNEEAGLISDDFIFLGKYRISSTRGGGWLNCYFARNARPISKDEVEVKKLRSDDLEKQTVVYINSKESLRKAILNQEFKEAKWTQTIALALLWMDVNNTN